MLRLDSMNGQYKVYHGERFVGSLRLYENPCHLKNCYVHLALERPDADISAELFHTLAEITGRPLQVMVSSADTSLIAFLIAGGFQCRRKCYEVNASRADYAGGRPAVPLSHCFAGEADYEAACQTMFAHYVSVHEAINPWTADDTVFRGHLPAEAVLAREDGVLSAVAFVEGNEIAYVWGADERFFADFAQRLVTELFSRYETLCFESDDGDWAAMRLRSLFKNPGETRVDTYVYPGVD